jgi:hypothetical protein
MASGILDMDNVKWSWMTFSMSNGSDTTHVVSTSNHAQVPSIEFDVIRNLAGGYIDNHGIVDLNIPVYFLFNIWMFIILYGIKIFIFWLSIASTICYPHSKFVHLPSSGINEKLD